MSRGVSLLLRGVFIAAVVLLGVRSVGAADRPGGAAVPPQGLAGPDENGACLTCHGDPTLQVKLKEGDDKSMFVDGGKLGASVHAKLGCTDCHGDIRGKAQGHESAPLRSARQFAIVYSEQCKRCHFANYAKTLDGVHHALSAKGNEKPAVCVDCHGSHDVAPASKPRSRISRTCAKCHERIVEAYSKSVHGKALLDNENPDVPACTDCHRAHDIADPRTSAWRLRMPQICGGCHTNEPMMAKYGLSTKVLSTYLADFHGSTTLLQQAERGAQPVVALCTDCHGIHDIAKTDEPGSKVMQANLTRVCANCHPGATANFRAAWLSHYEPTWKKAPMVYAVKVAYSVLIPFMIVGLVLQIILHLWRVVINR